MTCQEGVNTVTNQRQWAFLENGTPLPVEDGRHLYELGTRRAASGERNDANARAKRVLTRTVRVPLPPYLAEVPAAVAASSPDGGSEATGVPDSTRVWSHWGASSRSTGSSPGFFLVGAWWSAWASPARSRIR